MIEHTLRLIFNGLIQNANPEALVTCLSRELGLSDQQIRSILISPPRILASGEPKKRALLLRDSLEQAGARIILQPMADDASCPVPLPLSGYNRIKTELEKAAKGGYSLSLFMSTIEPAKDDVIPVSMLDGIEDAVEESIKDPVTAIAIDDTTLLLIDYFCDSEKAAITGNTLKQSLINLFRDEISITTGCAMFPDNGTRVSQLLQFITDTITPETGDQITLPAHDSTKARLSLDILSNGDTALELFQQILISARGKQFKWLSNRSPDELWLGLGGLPPVRQKEFLQRLPLESPLIGDLSRFIRDKRPPADSPDGLRKIDELLIQIGGVETDSNATELKQQIAEKIKRIDALPTLSNVAGRIAAVAKEPESTIEELTDIIKNDPALTLTMLKIVNSAFYGFPQKIETIERAVIILGREEVVNLSLGLAAARVIDISPVKGLYQPRALWHHLMGTALTCRFLCNRFKKKDEPGLFTAGLLHDFGKIFLVEHYAETYGRLHVDAAEYDIPLYELEEECFGINHAIIGKSIASSWNLPEPLVQAAAFHHQPYFATDHSQLAAIVGFADFLYHKACPSSELAQVVTPHSPCLTFGHWSILEQVFPSMEIDDIDIMIQEVRDFMETNKQVFTILNSK